MLSGFPGLGEGSEVEDEGMDMSKMVQEMNRKKKKSGGFQVTPPPAILFCSVQQK